MMVFDRGEPGLLAQISNVLVGAENGHQPPGKEPHRVTVGSLDTERSEIACRGADLRNIEEVGHESAPAGQPGPAEIADRRALRQILDDLPHLQRILGIQDQPVRKRGQSLDVVGLPAAPPHEGRQARQAQRGDRVIQVVGAQTFEQYGVTATRTAAAGLSPRSGRRGRRCP